MGTEKSPSSAFHFDEALFLAPRIYFSHFHQRLGRLSNVFFPKKKEPPEERRGKKEGRKLQPDEIVEEEPPHLVQSGGKESA